MANYNTFTNLIFDIGPQIQDFLRSRGSIFTYANTDFSGVAAANKGDTIDAIFASPMSTRDITPSPSGTNAPVLNPQRVQLVLSNWKEAPFVVTAKEEQEIKNGSQYLLQQIQAGVEAVVSQMELTFLQAAISGSGTTVNGAHGLSSSFAALVGARKNLADNKAPTENRAFIYPTSIGADLFGNTNLLKINEAGTGDALRNGQQGRVMGFDLVESNFLGSVSYQGSGSVGVALQRNGLGIAVRPANLGPNVVVINDPITGMPLTISNWEQEYQRKVSVSALWGTKAIYTGSLCVVLGS